MKRDRLHIDRFAVAVFVFVCAIVGFTDLARAVDEPMPADTVSVVDGSDTASDIHAVPYRSCSPRTAFMLGVLVPGGGQFYLHDWSGGIQAVVSDVIIVEAMRRSDATTGSIVFFISAVHVVEGLYAAYECRIRGEANLARNSGTPQTDGLHITPGFPESRVDRNEQSTGHMDSSPWRVELRLTIPLE
jgi:hypothetical protein